MNIKKAAILGAGAVGSYVIWGLSNKDGIELGVVAKDKRNKRLKNKGITINGVKYTPNVWTPKEAKDADLLIVCLKYGNLPDTLDDIEKIVGENTIVMSLMNGVDSEEIIGKRINPNNILHSFIKVASQKKEDGYHFDPETTIGIILGELQPPFESERIKAINHLFANTGIHWRVTEFIQEEIWGKFRLNVCNNLPQAILGAGVGCYHDSEHMSFIRKALRGEVESIAEAKGIDLSKIDDSSGRGSAVKASARYSTLQDIDAGRHTEIDMFSGALVRMGKELGIPTPYNEYTYHMIKALEEKNDGIFNYEGDNDKIAWSK
ncbi:ketopantoate reductase family protein [Eubacterium sp. AF36-5BH]|uniref:ketopantoate reductase family protein n=1 Tax=Eubacterium sp. AF36-5BH TaxID=2293108 RepID=UPI000E489C93|nr:2-dehydropantoate 2-reductase [Eubacterium sp. AF36-5BH]RGF50903.1 ketopantoate reductase family protein [Eubacterium sp. AF36-5BH]